MPFLMLAKCAEAQAIRKGWPEDLSNTFVGEEIEQASLTLHPAQAAAEGATRERLERMAATARSSSIGSMPRRLSSPSSARTAATLKPSSAGASAIGMRCANSGRAPADALGVKQELEKALASDGKPTK